MNELMRNETVKKIIFNFILPILVPVIVGLGSSAISTEVMLGQLETRVALIESLQPRMEGLEAAVPPLKIQLDRHEKALEKDFLRHEQTVNEISHKTDDQEKRLTRLETLVGETQALLSEIRTDVKILLRGGQQ